MHTQCKPLRRLHRTAWVAAAAASALIAGPALGQTAFGASTTIVFPVVANTGTFVGQMTVYNPNGSDVTLALNYYDANNLATAGAKTCNNVVVPANRSVQFGLEQCTLEVGSHFGLMVVSDLAGTNAVLGYSRTQNNAGAGFSIEGFPIENFSSGTQNATGLQRIAAAPTYQTNCFVGALDDAITYDLDLFDDTTGDPIGTTISGSLNAHEQMRYLDVFSAAAAAAGDYTNVRAQFTRTSGGTQQMIGFCTVQDNTSQGADFRIAKAVTPAPISTPPAGDPTATWNGAIQTLLNGDPLEFAGPTTPITLGATETVTAYGGGWFAKQSSGVGTVSVGICYQDQSGPGPITALGSMTSGSVGSSQTWHPASGSAALPAGTYNIGLCAQNLGTNSMNRNDHSSGFVFVTP